MQLPGYILLVATEAAGLTLTVGQLLAVVVPALAFFGYVLRVAMKAKEVESRVGVLEKRGDDSKDSLVKISETLVSIQEDIAWLRGALGEPGKRNIPHPAWTKKP